MERIASRGARPASRNGGGEGFAAVELPAGFDPRTLLTGPAASLVSACYERPAEGFALVGVGVAGRVEAPPEGGAAAIREGAQRLLGAPAPEAAPALRPRLLGGFAFGGGDAPGAPWDGFGRGRLTLPRMLFVLEGGACGVVLAPGVAREELDALLAGHAEAALAPGGGDPSRGEGAPLRVTWDVNRAALLDAVAGVAAEIRAGLYEKAVLAATREIESPAPIEPGLALARLREGYPDCHLFCFRAGDGVFLGASPEQLVGLREGRVAALGLAGSARRGRTPEEDAALGEALLHSAKDRIEHEIVVRALREGLAGLARELRAPNQPRLLRLRNIQHLATDVEADARAGVDVLDLVGRLHPTPAVCGWPTAAARAVIAERERFDRGWYAGPVGWVDAAGDGEFAVALRSALVRGARAWLFAGAGVTGDSDPERELAEIELKLRPLTTALGGGRM